MNRPRLAIAALPILLAASAPLGCARSGRQITPTTTGTNLKTAPRGQMNPLPFPGSSLARKPTDRDLETARASIR